MFLGLKHRLTGLIVGFLLVGGNPSIAQQSMSPSQGIDITQVRLADVVRNLPEYTRAEKQSAYLGAIENATNAERDSAIPNLMKWTDDERSEVRGLALLSLNLLYIPSEKRPGALYSASLPIQYIPAVAAHLRDPDPALHNVALAALQSVEYSGVGMDELVKLVIPMLREPRNGLAMGAPRHPGTNHELFGLPKDSSGRYLFGLTRSVCHRLLSVSTDAKRSCYLRRSPD